MSAPLWLALAGLCVAADPDDAAKKELAQIEGAWAFSSIEVNGTAVRP